MTRRSSTRAQAQEFYRQMVEDDRARESAMKGTPTPDPSPQGGGEESVQGAREQAAASGGGETTSLTARARELYEGSAVPVREIARLAGVSERTLYKYVEKGGWKRRYATVPRAGRGRGWQATTGFAPAKGAGGRFIRREDAGHPFAAGLKAIDPDGAARAAAGFDEAERNAARAEADAELDRLHREKIGAWHAALGALQKLIDLREERKTNPQRLSPEAFDVIERAMVVSNAAAVDALEVVQAKYLRAFERSHRR